MGGGNSHQRKMAAKAKERMADEVTERVLQKIEANPIAARAPNTNVEPKITSPSIKEKLGVFWGSTPVWSAICLLIGAYASQVSLKLLWFGAWVVLSSEIWRVRFFEGRTLKVVGNVTLSLILATVIYQIWKKSPKPEQPLPIDQKLNTFGDSLEDKFAKRFPALTQNRDNQTIALSPHVIALPASPRTEGLTIADDITNFIQSREKKMPSPETVEYMRETWTLFGQKFEGRIANVLDKLGRVGLQDRILKTEVQYLSSSTGNEDAIRDMAKKIRTLALLYPPTDLYKQTSDLQLSTNALDEASKIDTMTSEAMRRLQASRNTAEREFFAWHFKDCCLDQVEYLRVAMIERLGPVSIDDGEMEAFNGSGDGITNVDEHLEAELSSVLLYMPKFKALAEKLKARSPSQMELSRRRD